MKVPEITPRRPLDDDDPSGYLESDNDFVGNNIEACLWFLENRDKLARMAKALGFYADGKNWEELNTAIGMSPGPAIDYGAAAQEALA
jgi:hypothetical protein